MKKRIAAMAVALTLSVAAAIAAPEGEVLVSIDFEQPDAAKALVTKPGQTTIADEGCESKHAAARTYTGKFCDVRIATGDVQVTQNTVLSFDYKQVLHEGAANYLGVQIIADNGKIPIWVNAKPTPEWKHVTIDIMKLGPAGHAKNKEKLAPGDTVKQISFYGRGKEDTTKQTVYIDNVKIVSK